MGDDHRRNTVLSKCSNQTIWFERFVRGEYLQVRTKSIPNQAIGTDVTKFFMDKMEAAVKEKVSMLERRKLTKKGA